jgi:hypothetical protein
MNQTLNPSKITLTHHVRPVSEQDIQAPQAKPASESHIPAVLMVVIGFSLMITVSCLIRVCLYLAVRKMI